LAAECCLKALGVGAPLVLRKRDGAVARLGHLDLVLAALEFAALAAGGHRVVPLAAA
jgi:hypothetical protein